MPQGDDEFLAQLSPPLPSSQHGLALDLRRAIAAFAEIDPEQVHADGTFDDLGIGAADSIDELDLALRLEAVLGRELSPHERERIPSPEFAWRLQVSAFVLAVCEVAATRDAPHP